MIKYVFKNSVGALFYSVVLKHALLLVSISIAKPRSISWNLYKVQKVTDKMEKGSFICFR